MRKIRLEEMTLEQKLNFVLCMRRYRTSLTFPVPRRIFGFMMPDAQRKAVDVLAGNIIPTGRLPLKLNLK